MAVRAAVKARWKRGCGGETLRRFRSHWPGLTKPPAAGIDDPSVRPAAPPESVESAADCTARPGNPGTFPTRNVSDMRASPDPADWRDCAEPVSHQRLARRSRQGRNGPRPPEHPQDIPGQTCCGQPGTVWDYLRSTPTRLALNSRY